MPYQRLKIVLLLVFSSLVWILIQSFRSDQATDSVFQDSGNKMKGVCWVAGDSIAIHNIDELSEFGVNWISQTPFGWMGDYQSPEIRMNTERAWWGEADRGLKHTNSLAHAQGIKTMLKPHLWLRGTEGKWRSDIAMKTNQDWEIWFENYATFILHYASLAEECQMEALCIGTELQATTRQQPERWRALIKEIRSVYNGKLTYAANWYQEYEDIVFWDELDYIGIQAYFPLTKNDNPQKEQLIKSWNKHKQSIEKVARKFNKKVVFTEIGYKNTIDAATEPWSWPQHLDHEKSKVSDLTQLVCYQALFESVWNEPWMDGVFIWKWFHSTHKYPELESYFDERRSRRRNYNTDDQKERPRVDFTPQFGPAKEEMKRWYLDPR